MRKKWFDRSEFVTVRFSSPYFRTSINLTSHYRGIFTKMSKTGFDYRQNLRVNFFTFV